MKKKILRQRVNKVIDFSAIAIPNILLITIELLFIWLVVGIGINIICTIL